MVNPGDDLPPMAECVIADASGAGVLGLTTSNVTGAARVMYDRTSTSDLAPLPDDLFLVDDASTPTGVRPDLPNIILSGSTEQGVFDQLATAAATADGWSPYTPITIAIDAALDPATLPATPQASLDPVSSIAMFDLTPQSATFGQQVPFQAEFRSDSFGGAVAAEHTVSVFPSINLTPEGVYGVIVTRRLAASATAPLDPSTSFAQVLGAAQPGEASVIAQARAITEPMLTTINAQHPIGYDANDIALALQVSVRSEAPITAQTTSLRQTVTALTPSAITITDIEVPPGEDGVPSPVAAIVTGTWQAPEFRDSVTGLFSVDAQGNPVQTGSNTVDFVLALPASSPSSGAPLVLHMHGNNSNANDVRRFATFPGTNGASMASEGFAMIGFTDAENRVKAEGNSMADDAGRSLTNLILYGDFGNFELQGWAEIIAFVEVMKGLGSLDVLPLTPQGEAGGDGQPDLDVSSLFYQGVSSGAHKGLGVVAYLPDIEAGVFMVGGPRAAEAQTVVGGRDGQGLIDAVTANNLSLPPNLLFSGVNLSQLIVDRRTSAAYLPFLYTAPLNLGSSERASILIVSGLDDTFVPNNATRATALAAGNVLHVAPIHEDTVVLETTTAPLSANVNATTTAGYVQFVPAGIDGLTPTPGCENQPEGHTCAQEAPPAVSQRIAFFKSALDATAPEINDPLAP